MEHTNTHLSHLTDDINDTLTDNTPILNEPSPLDLSIPHTNLDDVLKAHLDVFVENILKTTEDGITEIHKIPCAKIIDCAKYFATRIENLGGGSNAGDILGREIKDRVEERGMDLDAVVKKVVGIKEIKEAQASLDTTENSGLSLDEDPSKKLEEVYMWRVVLEILTPRG
ncbi:hypothetical protein BDZ45DRAFT_795803 [Acephala macrosclerotiorum]|nr:hypothetical protein BDZ45DRAFT_795803 [Acephala macrosclerotiorum]